MQSGKIIHGWVPGKRNSRVDSFTIILHRRFFCAKSAIVAPYRLPIILLWSTIPVMTRTQRLLIPAILLLLMLWASPVRAQQDQTTYTVQKGDTLALIAQKYDVPVSLLARVNNITDPNLIRVGQVLIIPDKTQIEEIEKEQESSAGDVLVAPDMTPLFARSLLRVSEAHLNLFGFGAMASLLRQLEPLWLRDEALPLPFLHITAPEAIVQGETDVAWVTSLAPFPPTGSFQKRPLTFIGDGQDEDGYRFFALLPTGALDRVGVKNLIVASGPISTTLKVAVEAGVYDTQNIVLPPDKGGLLDPAKLKEERERLYAIWERISGPPQWTAPFKFPIAEGFPRTSPYGTRRSYNGGPVSSYHAGSDWGAPEGTPIIAPAPGTVVLAEPLFVRGGAVIIDHGAGVYSNFWHMSQIDVKPGDVVQTGDQLGLVGTTGLSTGAHLHWEIRVNGLAVDPLQWTEQTFP
jgi:murein DD-endopeptidase MepM/ murein hydrolase activator NlpD